MPRPQPIPSYLMALAVGEIDYRDMSRITGVYANPILVDAAAFEFNNTQDMIDAAEKLYGPYQWEKYDILVGENGFEKVIGVACKLELDEASKFISLPKKSGALRQLHAM